MSAVMAALKVAGQFLMKMAKRLGGKAMRAMSKRGAKGRALKNMGKDVVRDMASSGEEGKEGAGSKVAKIIIGVVMAILAFIFLIIIVIASAITSATCAWGLSNINKNCPKPIFDIGKTTTIAIKMTQERESAFNKDGRIQKFEIVDVPDDFLVVMENDEPGVPFGELSDGKKEGTRHLIQAKQYLSIMEQLDTFMMSYMDIDSKDFKEGGKYEDTNFGTAAKYGIKKGGRFWTNKQGENHFGEHRMNVWECYLYKTNFCGKTMDTKEVFDRALEDNDVHIPILNDSYEYYVDGVDAFGNRKDVKVIGVRNDRLKSILDEYYEFSLFAGVEDGKKMYDEALELILDASDFLGSGGIDQMPGKYQTFGMGYVGPMVGGYHLTSSWSKMRTVEVDGKSKTAPHRGTDLGTVGNWGVPYFATKSGEVLNVTWNEGAGTVVTVDHKDGHFSSYFHSKEEDIVVKPGQEIQTGQLIGGVGNMGEWSGGTHLHFELCDKVSGSFCTREYMTFDSEDDPFNFEYIPRYQIDETEAKELSTLFYSELKEQALAGETVLMPGMLELGWLAKTCETGTCAEGGINYAKCGTTKGDKGGLSCGAYQFAAGIPSAPKQGGSLQSFVKRTLYDSYPELYDRLNAAGDPRYAEGAKKFKLAWEDIVKEPELFEDLKEAMDLEMYLRTYLPLAARVKSVGGFDILEMSYYTQEMFFSMFVQHNVSTMVGRDSVLARAGLRNVGADMGGITEEELVKKMYKARRDKYSSITKRFITEEEWVLAGLKEEKGKEKN